MPVRMTLWRTVRAVRAVGFRNSVHAFGLPFQDVSRGFASSIRRREMTKLMGSAEEAIKDLKSGSMVLCGGFGLSGIPETLIEAVRNHPTIQNLTAVSNNAGVPDSGLSLLLASRQVTKMVASYIGENPLLEQQYLRGEMHLELTPQGTLAERCRAGGHGIPAFYTPAGMGTIVQAGGLPFRYQRDGRGVAEFSPPKNVKVFHGRGYVMEESIQGDYALIKAWKADKLGNCQFRLAAQNFNGVMARNARCTIVEAEQIVEPRELDPSTVHVPGIYVQRVCQSRAAKKIEKYTFADEDAVAALGTSDTAHRRERIVRRAAKELKNGMYANLGIGMPMLAPNYVQPGIEVQLQSENGILGLGPYPREGKEAADSDLINAGKETVTLRRGAAVFGSDESFGMIRAGRIDLTILGAMQVSAHGDLANWMLPGKVKGFGGAVDLVSNPKTKVVVTMEHTDKQGRPKILRQCEFPLTGRACVDVIITELGVFEVDSAKGLTLIEIADGSTVDEVKSKTEAPFMVSEDLKPMQI